MKLIEQSVRLITPSTAEDGIQAQKLIQFAARNCYNSQDKITDESYKKMLKSLISRGHTAPIQFADLTFDITTSRAVLAEITRHRLASFCVQSQRYIQEAKTGDISFIIPEWVDPLNDPKEVEVYWLQSMKAAQSAYVALIEAGMKPQEAREVLPNSTACRIIMKANAREFRHFFKLRCDKAAYPQIRRLANTMLQQAATMMPQIFGDLLQEETV